MPGDRRKAGPVSEDKKADVWMPIWIGSYLADTLELTTEQHGAYFLLLLAYWRKRGPLPDNDDSLRSITKLEKADWRRHRAVLAGFFRVADGVWWHKRVEAELASAEARAKKAADKARKAAQARWEKDGEQSSSNAPSMHQALHEHMLDECPPPSPLPPPSEGIDPNGSRRQADDGLPACPHDEIIRQYHLKLPELPQVKLKTDGRQKAMRSFWRWVLTSKRSDGQPRASTADQALTWISSYFERASTNDFLMGRAGGTRGHENWRCDLDFLLTERGRKHVIERTVEA